MADLILEIIEGGQAGRQVPLTGAIDLGREDGLPLTLEDQQASRRHARISPSGATAVVEDLGSTNGTFVNEQQVNSPRQLNPGDHVRVGTTVIELRSAQQVQARASAVRPVPQITSVDQGVFQPVPEEQLPGAQPAAAGVPGFLTPETPAGYVPPEIAGNEEAISDYQTIAALVDTNVKRQDNIAVFALLGAAGLAVALFFGLR